MEPDLTRFQLQLGYRFSQHELLRRALSHRSAGSDHNERLEFLGDSLVNTLIAERLFTEYPQSPEGELSAMRAALVCRESLASVARAIKLGDYILLGEGTLKTGGHRLDSILADAYEALLGAIYLDSDWNTVRDLVHVHFKDRTQGLDDMSEVRDAKSRLQEWLQSGKHPLPEYQVMNIDGPGHAQHFKVNCVVPAVPGEHVGEGTSRRKAEQNAAEKVLESIGNGLE